MLYAKYMLAPLFDITLQDVLRISLSTVCVFIGVITYTRIAGLRSFSKMSGFDFAMTVAVGSLMATTAVVQVSLGAGLLALAVLYLLQVAIALLRRFAFMKKIIDNQPVLLLKNGTFIESNMIASRVTRGDIISKLREANVKDVRLVQAVVLETTGDISVMYGGEAMDSMLLEGVKD